MRRHLLPAILLLLLAPALRAQPAISYIIPDIGTPGMNTYVEIIAPVSRANTFGTSRGLVGASVARVELVNPVDTMRVVVSPCVVSWNGRMISCQFFVKPTAAMTPSGVPFRVNIGGTLSNVDTFFIVAPQVLGTNGTVSGGGDLGSSATYGSGLGRRSKRGAMIVESLTLLSGSYGVSVVDTTNDNNPGNQGYLPFILLSRGAIVVASSASINVNARGKHGGPGGGGGGGYGPDRPASFPFPLIPGEEDAPQGDGYTGGRSAVPVIASPGPFGTGTGASSASLNGVTANSTFAPAGFSARLYGSGPGHPFDADGRSGGAALAAAAAPPNVFGTYYGGGGNATPGTGIAGVNSSVNGQPMGSAPVVPLHGGGGGSSGGPNDSIGGGGGGAMALYSGRSVTLSTAEARGANGRSGCATCGTGSGDGSAGGAGGSIMVGGRLGLEVQTATLTGGAAGANTGTSTAVVGSGGVGRYRHDGRYGGAAPTLVTGASRYTGPSLDTISYANNTRWTVTGSGRPGMDIEIHLRGENSQWRSTPYTTTVASSDSTWSQQIVFPYDSLAYLFVLQKTPTAERNATYDSVPHQIFSQVGASIVRLDIAPVIDAPAEVRLDSVICPETRTGRLTVTNRGTAPLVLMASTRFIGPNASLYTILGPVLPDTLLPDSSVSVSFLFNGIAAANGDRTDTLALVTNDPVTPVKKVIVRVTKEGRLVTAPPRLIDLGDVMVGTTRDTITQFVNRNSYPTEVIFVARDSGSGRIDLTSPGTFPVGQRPGSSLPLQFSFTPIDTGRFSARFTIRTMPCGVDTVVTVTGYARAPIIRSDGSFPFAALACSDTAREEIVVFNGGNAPLVVDYPSLVGADRDSFLIISPARSGFPITLQPGQRVTLIVRARSTVVRVLRATLVITSNDPFAGKSPYSIPLDTDPTQVDLVPSTTTVDFGTLCIGEELILPLILSTTNVRLDVSLERIDRTDSTAPFTFVSQWFLPFPVSPGRPGSQTLDLRFAPRQPGLFTDTLLIRSSPCDRLVRVVLRGMGVSSELVADRPVIQFGDVPVGTRPRQSVKLRNPAPAGTPPIVIESLPVFTSPDPQITIISPTFPPSVSLDPGEEIEIIVEYAPSSATRLPARRICVAVNAPCASTAPCVPIEGNGIIASIAASRPSLSMVSRSCDAPVMMTDTLSVTNIGTAPLDVTSIVATPAPTFTLVSPTGGFTLAPGTSRTVTVGYLPSAPSSTPTVGNLAFTTTDVQRPRFDIPLSGRRDTVLLDVDRRSILFPVTPSCAAPLRDSFVVRNSGTLADTVGVIDAGGALLSPAPPYILSPGEDTTIAVAIAPSSDGPWRAVIRLGSDPCARIDSVVLDGRRYTPVFTIGPVDFGDVGVASTGRASATITNPNPDPIRIAAATIIPASGETSIVPGQFPLTIAAGASATVNLVYTPAAIGEIAAGTILSVDIDTLCPATLTTTVTGRGVVGGLLVDKSSSDLGRTLGCGQRADTIHLRNLGTSTIMVTDIQPLGPAIPGLAISGRPLPHSLLPGEVDTLWPIYLPALGSPGIHSQTFRIKTTDPDRPEIDIAVRVDHQFESLALEGSPFPAIMPGTIATATRRLINNGTAPVSIRRLGLMQPFAIISTTPSVSLPYTLLPGDTLTLEVEFAPQNEGEYTASLDLLPVMTCGAFPDYTVTASAVGTVAATARWGASSGRPGDVVSIPLSLENDLASADVRSYRIAVGFNPTMLMPLSLRLDGTLSAGWTVTSSDLRAGEARFELSGPSALAGTGVLAYLDATVALGDSLVTTVRSLDGTATTSGRGLLTVAPGLFTLDGYCDVGGPRLVRIDGALALRAIRPNPASDAVEMEIELVESGRTRLRVVDLLGREVATLVDAELEPGIHPARADLRAIPAGLYTVVLDTPTGRLSAALVVTK